MVGGEAKRWARRLERSGRTATETAQPDAVPDVIRRREGPLLEPVEVAHRLWDPVQQYAMIDNALRAAEGRTLAQHRSEVADLWSRFNLVARTNPDAAFPAPLDADQIATASPSNRPLAFPYNKWHSTQWTVEPGGGTRVLLGGEAHSSSGCRPTGGPFPWSGWSRATPSRCCAARPPTPGRPCGCWGRPPPSGSGVRWPTPRPSSSTAASPPPSACSSGRWAWTRQTTPTVTGGMAFAGGPFNNFVFQSMVPVIRALRAEPAGLAVVTTVSGLLTKPGIGVWSGTPDGRPPRLEDLGGAASAAAGVLDVVETLDGYDGEATVATYTVTYEGMVPTRTVAVCDTADGRRCVAVVDDAELAAHAVTTELIGTRVRLAHGSLVLA